VFYGTFSTNRLYRAIQVGNISHRAGSLHFNGHFPGEPGLAGVYFEAKDDGGGGDNWTTGAISSSQIITTNKPTSSFYRPDALPVAQPTINQHNHKLSSAWALPGRSPRHG